MNLLKSPLRRTTAVLAGAFIGMAGAVALAAPASAHNPNASGSSDCVAKDGSWTINWSAGNDWHTNATIKKIVTEPNLAIEGDLAVGTEVDAKSTDNVQGTSEVTDAKIDKVTLKIWLDWQSYSTPDDKPFVAEVPKPTNVCKGETTPVPEIGEAKPIVEATCDSLIIGADNPENGVEFTLTFKPSKGEASELTIQPGEKKTTKFAADKDFSLVLGVKGTDVAETIKFEVPEGCASATPAPAPGAGGGEAGPTLPVTGAAAGSIAGGAAVLLVAGGVLFFMARRRKLKFTA